MKTFALSRGGWQKAAVSVAAGFVLLFLATLAFILVQGRNDCLAECDYAVVLGSKVEADGSPSPRLRARLDECVRLYRHGLFPRVIVSGGVDLSGHSEARVMKEYLVRHAIPENSILMDEKGNNTRLTAVNARAAIGSGPVKVMVISQYFHISRTLLAFRKAGFSKPCHAYAKGFFEWRDLYALFREIPGFWFYLLS